MGRARLISSGGRRLPAGRSARPVSPSAPGHPRLGGPRPAGSLRSALFVALALFVVFPAGCGGRDDDDAPAAREGSRLHVPFKLTAGRGDFLFEWVDPQGEFRTGSRIEDVPTELRAKVRVEPLTIPPERRAPPDRVYLADLRKAGPGGAYPVAIVPREDFEALAAVLSSPLPRPGAAPPRGPDSSSPVPPSPPGTPQVTIYGASWCGACRQAAAWLRAKGIPFVDKDIERDPGARQEMLAKCRAAGIAADSIPILDVRGRVVQGFSPGLLQRILGSS